MNSSVFKKFERGVLLALVLGILSGLIRFAWFLIHESYSFEEVRFAGVNLLYGSLHEFMIYALIGSLAFTVIWYFYHRLEGLVLALLVAGAFFLPFAYYVNKQFLPGIREASSLIGNGVIGMLAAAATMVVFRRWTCNRIFVKHVTSRGFLVGVLILYLGCTLAYRLQPTFRQLYADVDSQERLRDILDNEEMKNALGLQNGIEPEALLEKYYKVKSTERRPRLRAKLLEHDTTAIIAYADSILERKFRFVGIQRQLPTTIDWRKNPTKDKVWLYALNRQEWIWEIAASYLLTADSKYAEAFEEILESWFEQNPRLDWKNEPDPVWRLMESSLRMSSSWIDAFTVFFPSHHISDKLKWRVLASFHEHAQFLAHFRSPGKNHLLQETFGLLSVAGAFPEFKMSDAWLEIANRRLENTLKTEIYPDGGYIEGSTFYHRFVVRILQQIADFAAEYKVSLSELFYTRLEEMYDFLMHVALPDGVMPQINDGFRAKSLRILYEHPAEFFERSDFEFFASDGARGAEPETKSVGFPYSGIYVMRSDWSLDARYMIADAGLFGSAHGHEDKLSFELFAFGKPFIVEAGTYTYKYDDWHRYFESSFAHNTVVVDGRSQMRMPNEARWASEHPKELPNVWHSTESFDFLQSEYDQGYGNNKEDILSGLSHSRRILFVKPDYWILWDVVSGDGEYSANQLFHFPPDARVSVEGGQDVRASHGNGPQLVLKTLVPKNVSVNKVIGSEDPIQGWISPEYGVKQPASAVEFTTTGNLPHSFVTILFPTAQAEESKFFDAELLEVSDVHGSLGVSQAVAVKVQSSKSIDWILMAPGIEGEMKFSGLKSPWQLLLRREMAGGEIKQEQIAELRP